VKGFMEEGEKRGRRGTNQLEGLWRASAWSGEGDPWWEGRGEWGDRRLLGGRVRG